MSVAQELMTAKMNTIDLDKNLATLADYRPSPFFNDRPKDGAIDLIVIHSISLPPKEFCGEDVEAFFCGELDINKHPYYAEIAHLRVAPHLYIKRNGQLLQFVPFDKRAWHAGESSFAGRKECNDYSIGIELEGCDDIPFEEAQYRRLAEICQVLMESYPAITRERIVGHADVAPGRKTDPGPMFEWELFRQKLQNDTW